MLPSNISPSLPSRVRVRNRGAMPTSLPPPPPPASQRRPPGPLVFMPQERDIAHGAAQQVVPLPRQAVELRVVMDEGQVHCLPGRSVEWDCSTRGTLLAAAIARRRPFLYNCSHGFHIG